MSNTRTSKNGTAPAMSSIEEILAQAKPLQRTVFVCVNGELQAEYDEAKYRAAQLRMRRREGPADESLGSIGGSPLDQEIAAAEDAERAVAARMQSLMVPFRFKALPPVRDSSGAVVEHGGKRGWFALEARHRTDQVAVDASGAPQTGKDGEPIYQLDSDWAPDVLSRCAVTPAMTIDQARALIDQLSNETSLEAMIFAAMEATFYAVNVPFSSAASPTPTLE
jgi:hypothetical protein